MPHKFVAGVDLGGTKIRTGLVDPYTMRILSEPVVGDTEAETTPERVLENIARTVESAIETAGHDLSELGAVGIGSPGPLDMERGVVLEPRNLPALHDCPLAEMLSERLKVPVALNNDGNVFVLGETMGGAARGHSVVYGVTLGTGFGGGFVIDGKIFNGATGTAAEIWCFKYGDGIIEDYVSGRGLRDRYERKTGAKKRPKEIADAARSGETAAIETFREFGHDLGIALSWVVNVVDPALIVVGGSIIRDWKLFADPMEEALRPHINAYPRERLKVVPAALGADAAVIGAASLVLEVNVTKDTEEM